MRKKLTFLIVAIMALPSLCAASDAIKDDSVKVIKNPEQVTITKRDGAFRINVEGNETDKDYRYEYFVKKNKKKAIEYANKMLDVDPSNQIALRFITALGG